MAIKTYKPTTPGRRQMTNVDYSCLSKVAPEKSLLTHVKKNAGRNSYGRITVRHQGGGNKKKYRIIDFKRNSKIGMTATVDSIQYDPNRSALLLLLFMRTEQSHISSVLKVFRLVINLFLHPKLTSSPVIHYRLKISLLVHLSTILNFTLVKALSSFVQQATLLSLWQKRTATLR